MSPAPTGHVVLMGAGGADPAPVAPLLADTLQRQLVDADAGSLDAALADPRPAVIAIGSAAVPTSGPASGDGRITVVLRPDAMPRSGNDADSRDGDRGDLVVGLDPRSPSLAADRIAAALRRRVEVPLGDRSYPVLIGPGVRAELASVLPSRARRVAVVTQERIGIEVDTGRESRVFTIDDGESAKSMATIERLCREFALFGLTRADVVVALGGGVVTDAAGFAAACYHRGMDYVNVSTTLLGQIDAAVGGKTAVNIPEGKNLIGAFWQPAAVICDTDTLVTLPEREWRSGLGEMAKYAFLGVDDLDTISLVDAVAACVSLKADVVSSDEREGDRRMLLNYGHTLAHAMEAAGFADGPGRDGIDLRHGEAVAIGIAFAARLARVLGRIDDERVERHLEVLAAYGLPAEIPAGVEVEEMVERMGRDKKATAGLTFVLDSARGVEVVSGVEVDPIREAFAASGPGSARLPERSQR